MQRISLNPGWKFKKLPGCTLDQLPVSLPDGPWENVSLPHTWYRKQDAYQGLTVYEKTVPRDSAWQTAILSFEAADQQCRVFVNGHFAGGHRGGYARFRLPVPQAAMADEAWRIRVFLENSLHEEIAPSFGDFTVFGGLYRNVDLLIGEASHFDRCYYGTDGLIVRAGVDEAGRGVLTAEPHTVCDEGNAKIVYHLVDENGALVQTAEGPIDQAITLAVAHPLLWDGLGHAHLYTLTATLRANGRTADEVSVRTGFRRLALDANKGLFLNGKKVALRGVAKHQDRADRFCAVSDADVREDFSVIAELGANAVRLSHYQHPQAAYDRCDEMGLLAWAEIPMLKMTESPDLMENAAQQLTELILQNLHHPAVFCWGIQNEIAMFRDAPFMYENCRKLHGIVKALDPARFSACANLYPLKASSRLNEITDLVGYNIYFGWYYGEMRDYGPYLDQMHAARPALPLGISEYGVDANLALHSETPQVKDYSEEYQALWHETVYPQIESREYLWGSFIWNLFDFSSARRDEGGQKFINAKGLATHDRKIRKDAFYYYKARWSAQPFVHLCAKRFEKRAQAAIDIKCYTNQPEVRLLLNGKFFGTAKAENGTAVFRQAPLQMGENRVTAMAGECVDHGVWLRVSEPEDSYRLPQQDAGTAVRNWFLAEDDVRKEGFFSIQNTAQELLDNPETKKILEKYVPALVKIMTEKSVIPLGLSLKSILSRDADGTLDVNALNGELNRIPDSDA
ncbi:MAG: hypothetical protein IJ662_00730 [Clostridia bacterium]|nr:hypothetical protein [Clostridia bacterium]